MKSLVNRRLFITGMGSGIGLATAQLASAQGAQVSGRTIARRFITCQLGRDFRVLQPFGLRIHENLVNHVGRADGDSR